MDFSILETLRIAEAACYEEWQRALIWSCLAGLALICCVVAVRYALKRIGEQAHDNKIGLAVFLVGATMAILYGGIGSGWGFAFVAESGLHDNGSWVDTTNAVLYARWTYDPWVSGYKFKWCYTYKYGGETKGPFVLPDAEVSAGHAEYQLTVPQGQDWSAGTVTCYTEYVQPIHVVTNGTYHLYGIMRSIDTTNSVSPKFVTPGVFIYANLEDGTTELVAPPTNAPTVPVSVPLMSLTMPTEGE